MNEKQRWLLRDLESWRDAACARLGKYGPKKAAKEPAAVKAARRSRARADVVIHRWEAEKDKPWKAAKAAIQKRADEVRRVILFEKTEAALRSIRALR